MYKSSREKCLIFSLIVAILAAIGAIIGCIVLATQKHPCNYDQPQYVAQDLDLQQKVRESMMNSVKPENIRDNLVTLTKDYHPAGSEANMRAMDFIAKTWRSYGLDLVEEERYDILLSYPDYEKPNTICLKQTDGSCKQLSAGLATKLGPPEAQDQQHDNAAMNWWNAYSKNGNATGNIVYVNYCTVSDYEAVDNLKLNLSGKIVLCRYGNGFRGDKIHEAEKRNAIGVIMYSDPADSGPPSDSSSAFVFPNSFYMPQSGAQRGTMSIQSGGDPETPFYPSKNYTYRWYDEDRLRKEEILPNIPVTPIGYEDAYKIFQAMADHGTPIPADLNKTFVGGLNLTYYLTSKAVFHLEVNVQTFRNGIKNVIGYIWGKEEPDRHVYLSNHVDAWAYGSLDPNSGTAIHLEVSRTFMAAVNATQWRPRRTIVFCAWDAEEYGLGGSTEWVQQKLKVLESRGIAVLNVDIGIIGNLTLDAQSAPLLYRTLVSAAKLVPNPNADELAAKRAMVYDSWKFYSNASLVSTDPTIPYMSYPSSGSDDSSFMMYVGIPSTTFWYTYKAGVHDYPLYHSMYEIEWTVENLLDRNFSASAAMTKIWGEVIRDLADSLVIPFNVTDYGVMMTQFIEQLNQTLSSESNITVIIDNFAFVIGNLTECGDRFLVATRRLQSYVDYANSGQPIFIGAAESLNNRLCALERCFINPRGLPDRPANRHIVFAPSVYDDYSGTVFAGVTDSLQQYKIATSSEGQEFWRRIVNLQLTVIQYSMESAIQLLYIPKQLIPL